MPKGIKGFQKDHPTFNKGKCPKGRIPWNKDIRGQWTSWNKGRSLSESHRLAMSVARIGKFTGEKAGAWKGGLSPVVKLIRQSNKGVQWRQQVFLRDDFTCQQCGMRGGKLIAHHKKLFIKLVREAIKYLPLFPVYEAAMAYSPLWDLDNGITVCRICHEGLKHRFAK